MKKYVVYALIVLALAVIASACAPAPTPIPPTSAPVATTAPVATVPAAATAADEIHPLLVKAGSVWSVEIFPNSALSYTPLSGRAPPHLS